MRHPIFIMDKNEVMRRAEAQALPVIEKYYQKGSELYELLLTHSRLVAHKALECMERHPEHEIDADTVARCALLHDIGIVRTKAEGIHCHGTEPYIRHGILGRAMLEKEGMMQDAMVCERHTGAGITAEEIEMAQMPLPVRDMLPLTLTEKVVCYADKFYSKSGDPRAEKTPERIRASLARFGSASIERFDELRRLFG